MNYTQRALFLQDEYAVVDEIRHQSRLNIAKKLADVLETVHT